MKPNDRATWVTSIDTTTWVLLALEQLARSGRFGSTREAVAEELLRTALRDLERDGSWLRPRPPKTPLPVSPPSEGAPSEGGKETT